MSTETTTANLLPHEIEELEDRLDAVLLRLARVEQANDEAVPFALVERLSDGAVPTKVWREYRNLSRDALAQAARVPVQLVAQIEDGKEDIPLRTMQAIAAALDVDLDDLVPWEQGGDTSAGGT